MNNTSQVNGARIEMVDALRGFSVLAILLVHSVEHFIFPVYPESSPAWLQALDTGVMNVTFSLFAGKAYAIFSLLFGFTFCMQYERERELGKDFGYRFLWRLVGLALLATLNAIFFPAGDVLLLYAVMGLVLFVVRKWSDKAVLWAAIFFTLQPMEWFHYLASLFNPDHQLPDYGVGPMYEAVGEVVKSGNWWDFIVCNVTLGQKASFMWAVGAGRVLQTAGLFLIGLYIGRKQWFVATEENIRLWTKILIVSAVLFAPLHSLRNLVMEGNPLVQQTVGTAFDMWQKLAFTFVLVASFVLLYQHEGFRQRVSSLRFYGRMSLTSYVSQSLLGALIYFPIGLYLAPYCGYALSVVIGLGIFVLQVQFSKWWFRCHRQGPLEGLWYKWTWIGK